MHGYDKLYKLVAPHILDVNWQVKLLKETILYQLFADHFNVFVCAAPSIGAKSNFRITLEKITPPNFFNYIFIGGRTTKIGMMESIGRTREGLIMIDEIHRAGIQERMHLYDLLQFQVIKIDKFGEHLEQKAKVNIIGMCNPKPNGLWNSYGNIPEMRRQIPADMAFLRRFHASMFLRDYTPKEFDKINRFKGSIKKPYVTEDECEFFQDELMKRRMLEPEGEPPENVFNFLKNMKKFSGDIITPVTNELMDGIKEVAKARARLRNSDTIETQDWKHTLEFYITCLHTSGLTKSLIKRKFIKGIE